MPACAGLVYQALILLAVLGVVAWMVGNAQHALAKRGIRHRLCASSRAKRAFPISQSLIPYATSDSFLRAFARRRAQYPDSSRSPR